MSENVWIPIDSIRIDGDIQMRATGTMHAVVERYAAAMRTGEEFPPIDVFHDGDVYWLSDGFHRVAAKRLAAMPEILATVHKGGRRDAMLHAMSANSQHGVRRNRADTLRAMRTLLSDPEWAARSDNWITKHLKCGFRIVLQTRAEMGKPRPELALGRDGRFTVKGPGGKRGHKINDHAMMALVSATTGGYKTFNEVCNLLDSPPRRIERLAEFARSKGHDVNFAVTRDERAEYQRKLQMRELNEAKTKLLEELRQKDVQLESMMALKLPPVEPIRERRGIGEGKNRQGTPVMVLSDLHIEEKVTLEKTMGLNEYNPEIAKRCIERCAEAFEWFEKEKKHRWDMRQAILAIIGDTFSNWIHAELIESNYLSPIQAVVWLQDELERLIRTILATTEFEGILVVLKDGNHGRTTQKMRASTRTENSLEWLMFHTLAARFQNEPRLRFQIDESIYSYVECYDKTIAFTHGDQWQYMGGIGGLLIPVRRGLNEARKYRHFHTMVAGHFHTYMPLDDIHINGSAIGVTPYSLSKSIPPEPRRQSYFLLDSVNWKTDNCPVWLVKEPEQAWKNPPVFAEEA